MTVSIAITSGEMDPECMRCAAYIEVRGVLLLDADDPMCPACVPPAVARAAEAIQAVYDVLALDAGADEREAIGNALGMLSRLAGRLAAGTATVHKRVDLLAEPWPPGDLVGLRVDYRVDGLTGGES